jgi:hypothetical protein
MILQEEIGTKIEMLTGHANRWPMRSFSVSRISIREQTLHAKSCFDSDSNH